MSGAGDIDFDRKGTYVSVDIGIQPEHHQRLRQHIGESIVDAARLLKEAKVRTLEAADFEALGHALREARMARTEN